MNDETGTVARSTGDTRARRPARNGLTRSHRLPLLAAALLLPFAAGCTEDTSSDSAPEDQEPEQVAEAQQAVTVTKDTTLGNILATQAAAAATTPVALAAAVVVNGQVFYNVWGNRKLGVASPVQNNDRFSMGSITKPITGEYLARKVDAGYLTWNTTMLSQLSGVFLNDPNDPHRNATLAQLMSHTAGFAYQPTTGQTNQYANLPYVPDRRIAYDIDAINDPLLYPLGTIPIYDGGPVIATSMIENLQGIQYENDIPSGLFVAAGMSSASFDALSATGSITGIYNHSGSPLAAQPPVDQHVQRSPVGGLGASMPDMGRFMSYALGSHPSQRYTVGRSRYTPLGWAELASNAAGGIELNHNGTDGSYYSLLVLWPARGVGIIVSANSNNQAAVNATMAAIQSTLEATWGAPAATFPQVSAPTYLIPAAQVTASNTYQNNVAAYGPAKAFDGQYGSRWAADAGISTPITLEVTLNGPTNVSGMVINEAGPFAVNPQPAAIYLGGQQVQEFRINNYTLSLYNGVNGTWTQVASGTSIGPNLKKSFGTTYLNITKARLSVTSVAGPTINEFHLLQ